jgi:hypothetical protein
MEELEKEVARKSISKGERAEAWKSVAHKLKVELCGISVLWKGRE